MLKKISPNYLYLGKFFLIFLILVIIFLSIPFSAKIPYFWQDFTFAKQAHNENLLKRFLEVLPNSKNINGITIWILEPSLNFLSKLNYNISSKYEFYKYFSVLRTLEILTLLLFLLSFKEKFELKNILTILFLYLILLVNFNRYDHESYINFPIIIFCLFHAASIRIKNNLIFFLLIFLGNLWSFLINPIYFFVICFGPLIFFYTYHLYHKQFKKFFLTLIANIPFTILFIMLSLGTSRFALSELYLGYDSIHRNVALFTSKNFIIISILFLILTLRMLLKKNDYYCWFFIIFIIFTSIVGLIFRFDPQAFKMPPPYQFEYAFQYLLIFAMYKIIKNSEKDFLYNSIICILLLICLYRSYFYFKTFFDLEFFEKKYNQNIINSNSPKTNLWLKESNHFFLEKDLKNKKVFVNLPNFNSNFSNSFIKSKQENIEELYWKPLNYYKAFNASLQNHHLWKNNITTSGGYSHILDINSTLANYFNPSIGEYFSEKEKVAKRIYFTDKRIFRYQTIPEWNYKNPLLNFYNFDYILSDVILDEDIKKIYKFEKFNLYIYKISKLKKDRKINKINAVVDAKNYSNDIYKFHSEAFINKVDFSNLNSIKKFCEIESSHIEDKIIFDVKKDNSENCLAVFPIPFSYNNFFIKKNNLNKYNDKCKTFRVQYYFHGCIIKTNEIYILKKNNLFLYAIGSFRDFYDYKFKKY